MVAIAFECACQDELYCEVGKYCHTRLGGYARAAQSLESGSKLCKDYNLNVVDDPTSSDHYWEESVTIEECASYCWGRHDAVGELYTGFRHEYGGTDDKYSNTEGNCFCMALRWNSDLCDTNAEKTVHSTYYQYDFAVDATTVKKEAACLDFPHCDNAGYTPAGQSGCTCGNAGVTCPEGQYCHKSECSAHPYECLNTHGHTKNALGCRCGNETCADGKFCHKDDDTVNKQCADTDSSAFMLKIDESCKPGLEIDDFTKCKAFCERFGNPDDPGNCEVRDVVANDGFVSLYYPPRLLLPHFRPRVLLQFQSKPAHDVPQSKFRVRVLFHRHGGTVRGHLRSEPAPRKVSVRAEHHVRRRGVLLLGGLHAGSATAAATARGHLPGIQPSQRPATVRTVLLEQESHHRKDRRHGDLRESTVQHPRLQGDAQKERRVHQGGMQGSLRGLLETGSSGHARGAVSGKLARRSDLRHKTQEFSDRSKHLSLPQTRDYGGRSLRASDKSTLLLRLRCFEN